jgi:uncharacterized protein YbaR (Trm112 family)
MIPGPEVAAPMRKDMMDILVCPVCKGTLTLKIDKEEGEEVIEGSLHCANCNESYPITESIPNLLPPELRRAMEAGQAR